MAIIAVVKNKTCNTIKAERRRITDTRTLWLACLKDGMLGRVEAVEWVGVLTGGKVEEVEKVGVGREVV